MKKKILTIIAISYCGVVFNLKAQVMIGFKKQLKIHDKAILQIDGDNGNEFKGLIPPSITKENNLPFYGETVNDITMKGMLFYESSHATFYTYNGSNWINEISNKDFKKNKSRFLANKDDKQSVVCVVLGCGSHEALQFNAEVDGELSYNNLNIKREDAEIKYGLRIRSFKNAKFVINESGLYEISMNIPSKLGGAISLTSGPRYQLRAYLKNKDNSYEEVKLTDFAPNYYNVLGIGADLNTGAYTSTQIRLNKDDYIISRIDSPGLTVSVVTTLTADSDESIANDNPREIFFTKISD